MLSRKYYNDLAKIIKSTKEHLRNDYWMTTDQKHEVFRYLLILEKKLIKYLEEDNERFNAKKFIEASTEDGFSPDIKSY